MIVEDQLIKESKKYGRKWSLLFFNFSYWLLKRCYQLKIDKVYFFTREGEFFHKLINIVGSQFDILMPQLNLLEVSRLSTFLPSVNFNKEDAFQRLWNIYPNQSPEAFFLSLGVNDLKLKELYNNKKKNSYGQIIQNIGSCPDFRNFLNDILVKSIIKNSIEDKKSLLAGYLKQKGFFDDKRIAVVDIGWRGSIQDNLNLTFPQKFTYGFYLGLHRFKENHLPLSQFKEAFLFNANDKKDYVIFSSLMRFVLPLEFLCTPVKGTVIGYNNRDGVVIPEIALPKVEEVFTEKIITSFQESVFKSIDLYKPKEDFDLKRCRKIAKEMIWAPKEFQVFFYKKNHFTELFGVGKKSICYTDQESFKMNWFNINEIFVFLNNIKHSGWPSGYCYSKFPRLLLCLLPIIYLIYCLLTADSYLVHEK